MALMPLKAGRVVKEGVNLGDQGRGGWRGVAERSGGVAEVGRREVGDGTDRWGPLGGDIGRRRHRRAAQT
jgi:hypothetical protein